MTSTNDSVTVVEGETLELIVMITSNLVLDSITWSKDGVMLENGTDNIIINNSDLGPPNTTSTLIRTSIVRLSDIDSGVYEVTATNRAGSSTTAFDVDVFCKECAIHVYIYFSVIQ